MRTIILIILAAFALGAVVSAAYPVEVAVTGDPVWMVADEKSTATITATVTRGTGEHAGDPLEGANVTFRVSAPWMLKDSFLVTDAKGQATTTLLATKTSGTANITVTASAMITTETWGTLNYSSTKTYGQLIDHNTPSSIVTGARSQVQVRTPTPILVLVKDKYGNRVDNRKAVEKLQFDAAAGGLSGFFSDGSYVKSLTVPVNETGFAEVSYLVDPVGPNYVSILPPGPVKSKILNIEGISQGIPCSVTSVAIPGGIPYPYTTVKTGIFTIIFTFYDQYGYPTMNQAVDVTKVATGETLSYVTNKNGMVFVSYGPEDIADVYTVTATAVKNRTVSASQKVEFVSSEPTDAFLTASPQTMASRDVKDDITSNIIMRVVDQKGNPVEGEMVSFRMVEISVDKKFNQTQAPVLENGVTGTSLTGVDITGVSDALGEAMVTFHPGAFTIDQSVKDYDPQAQGTAVIEARWSTISRQLKLSYVNYPYLTVQSWVSPSIIRVNDTVDVTVKVTGDGWALQPKPIRVILGIDRSGSMLYDDPDRMESVRQAAKGFLSQMSPVGDSVGLVTFGYKGSISRPGVNSMISTWDIDNAYIYPRSYTDYATLDARLGTPPATVSSTIDQVVPDGGTPMRYSLKLAIDEMIARTSTSDKSVKAIILLSDGDYNYYGDPLARNLKSPGPTDPTSYGNLDTRYLKFTDISSEVQQNMAEYAKQNKIRIFTIGFAKSISVNGQQTLSDIATGTEGRYYYAPTADMLPGIYADIAGTLKDTAGVNTTMNLSFGNIMVNNVSVPGNEVYNYTYIDGHSTLVDTWNLSGHFPGYPRTIDSTAQWKKDRVLNFNIGTIRLGQVWQSTATLKVLKEGNIQVFDSDSGIFTEDLKVPLKIPEAFITALPGSNTSTLVAAAHLQIQNFELTNPGSKTSANLAWDLVYDGDYPVSEDLMIAPYGTDEWTRMPGKLVPNTTRSDVGTIPIETLGEGYYTIRLDANAYDANEDSYSLNILINEAGEVSVVPPGVTPTGTPGPMRTPVPKIKIS